LGYFISPKGIKNYWLLLCSLIFFAWGGVSYTAILLGSIVINYFFGILIERNLSHKKAYTWLKLGVGTNLLLLIIFKYANFIISNLNALFQSLSIPAIQQSHILLPIGISFYTFHSLSYLVDIYHKKTTAQKNIFDLALYISMFSQLIAGPIIRYSDVWQQLRERTHSLSKFSSGIERFLIGLGKKVLLANTFARVADDLFKTDAIELNALTAWLGIISYSLQIYCDFAGYSDMAIGLGRMFGFEFKENFNFPYMAKSVKEFWRRWHISLSSFFRDYVYIALGGNKVSVSRTYFNLIFVFFLTGFWHGASWSFVIWGLFHGFFMLLERIGLDKILEKMWAPFANLYTVLVVMLAWVLFRADSLTYALDYWMALFRFKTNLVQTECFLGYMNIDFYIALTLAILGSWGFFDFLKSQVAKILNSPLIISKLFSYSFQFISILVYGFILILCSAYLLSGTYNPFIYYRF
jgi:alginate O-acetyltransferase complex protein AlgI